MTKKGEIKFLTKFIFQQKKDKSYTKQIIEALKLITYNINHINIVGSFRYRAQPYPADIDCSEDLLKDKQKEITQIDEAVDLSEKRIKLIIEKIKESSGYIGDIKCGYDPYFYMIYFFYIAGFTGHVKKEEGQLVWESGDKPYFRPNRIKQLMNLYISQHLIDREFYNHIMKVLQKSNPDIEEVYELIRQRSTLRWTYDEIMQGYKDLSGGRRRSFKQCLYDPALTKIDMWKFIQEKWLEVTNVLILEFDNGKKVLGPPSFSLEELIQDDIYKLASSPHFDKPFKLAKRLFSAAQLSKNYEDAEILVRLFRSDYGVLSQIVSETNTIIDMIDKLQDPPITRIYRQLDNFKQRISTILSVSLDFDSIYSSIDNIINEIYFNKIYILKQLEELVSYLKKKIDPFTYNYLKSHGLYPVPKRYHLPTKIQYYELPPYDATMDIEIDPFIGELISIKQEFE